MALPSTTGDAQWLAHRGEKTPATTRHPACSDRSGPIP
jgi:hypothetical protein